jgi:uncharacterized protein (DUF1778 family)
MTATARLDVRVDPDVKALIEHAAAFAGTSVSTFVIAAAQVHAEEVVRRHTVLPADFFDALITELDEPAVANEAITRAVRRSRARGAKY